MNHFKRSALISMLISITAILLVSAASAESGDDDAFLLDPITVIATKTPKASLDSPASVSMISEEEVDAFSSEHPFKPLFRTEGIYPRQYRGLADYWSRPVIRGNRALVMVDGLNWYDYGQYYQTGAIPMKDVEKIEVVRGPFSALYGTLAQTGVINYITKIPNDMEAEASFTFGTDNTKYYTARIADRPFANPDDPGNPSWAEQALGDRFFYSMSFKYRTTDGYETAPKYSSFDEDDLVTGELDATVPVAVNVASGMSPRTGSTRYLVGTQGDNWYEDYGVFLKTGYEFSDLSKIWYSFNTSRFENGYAGGKSYLTDADGNLITDGEVYIQDGADYYLTSLSGTTFTATTYQKESNVHTLHYDYSVPDKVDVNAIVGYNDKESRTYSVSGAYTEVAENDLLQADLSATFHMMDNRFLLTVGTQGVKETVAVTKYSLTSSSDSDSWASVIQEESGKNLTWGTFVQAEYTPIESTTLYLGGRYDQWWATDTEYSDISGNHSTSEDMDDGRFSPKASAVFRLTENGVLRASYGESFTAPSLYYRIYPYTYSMGGTTAYATGNPELGPTTNSSWELGTEWEFLDKHLRVKTTYFQNDFEGLVANATRYYIRNGELVEIKKRINVDTAEVNGIETGIEAILPRNLKGGIHYTHHWSEYTHREDESKEGWEVEEVPTDIFNFWLGYFGDFVDASVNLRYSDSVQDDRYDAYDDCVFEDYSESTLVDSQVTIRPNKKMSFTLSVDNLLDEEYWEYYKGPGRTILTTISLSL